MNPTIFSVALFSPSPQRWRSVDPTAAGTSNNAFAFKMIGWTTLLTLFVWFGGLIHLDADGVRLSWSEISSMRIGAAGEHLIATIGGKEFSIGPYASAPIPVARCLASVFAITGAMLLMRFLILPLTWERGFDEQGRSMQRAGANVLCSKIMAAQVLWWLAIATLLFVVAMIAPASMLPLERGIGRGALGVIVLLGPTMLMFPQIDPLPVTTAASRGAVIGNSWVAAIVQFLAGSALLLLLVLIGASLSMLTSQGVITPAN